MTIPKRRSLSCGHQICLRCYGAEKKMVKLQIAVLAFIVDA